MTKDSSVNQGTEFDVLQQYSTDRQSQFFYYLDRSSGNWPKYWDKSSGALTLMYYSHIFNNPTQKPMIHATVTGVKKKSGDCSDDILWIALACLRYLDTWPNDPDAETIRDKMNELIAYVEGKYLDGTGAVGWSKKGDNKAISTSLYAYVNAVKASSGNNNERDACYDKAVKSVDWLVSNCSDSVKTSVTGSFIIKDSPAPNEFTWSYYNGLTLAALCGLYYAPQSDSAQKAAHMDKAYKLSKGCMQKLNILKKTTNNVLYNVIKEDINLAVSRLNEDQVFFKGPYCRGLAMFAAAYNKTSEYKANEISLYLIHCADYVYKFTLVNNSANAYWYNPDGIDGYFGVGPELSTQDLFTAAAHSLKAKSITGWNTWVFLE